MTTTAVPSAPLADSFSFFEPVGLWNGPMSAELHSALAAAPAVNTQPDSVFTTTDQGLISCILAEQEVAPALQKQLNEQKQNLIDLCGVASAYVRKQADRTKNPDLVYDTTIWQDVFNHLPLMGPSQFTRQSYNESIHGVELAGSFVNMIMGFAVGGGSALVGFGDFLKGLGEQIRGGVSKTRKTFSTSAITIVLRTQKIGGEVQLVPTLKGYFIDFSDAQTQVYSNCASYESFHMQFDYRVAESVFNFGALSNKAVADKFSAFIHGTQIDDIQNADNFFGDSFTEK